MNTWQVKLLRKIINAKLEIPDQDKKEIEKTLTDCQAFILEMAEPTRGALTDGTFQGFYMAVFLQAWLNNPNSTDKIKELPNILLVNSVMSAKMTHDLRIGLNDIATDVDLLKLQSLELPYFVNIASPNCPTTEIQILQLLEVHGDQDILTEIRQSIVTDGATEYSDNFLIKINELFIKHKIFPLNTFSTYKLLNQEWQECRDILNCSARDLEEKSLAIARFCGFFKRKDINCFIQIDDYATKITELLNLLPIATRAQTVLVIFTAYQNKLNLNTQVAFIQTLPIAPENHHVKVINNPRLKLLPYQKLTIALELLTTQPNNQDLLKIVNPILNITYPEAIAKYLTLHPPTEWNKVFKTYFKHDTDVKLFNRFLRELFELRPHTTITELGVYPFFLKPTLEERMLAVKRNEYIPETPEADIFLCQRYHDTISEEDITRFMAQSIKWRSDFTFRLNYYPEKLHDFFTKIPCDKFLDVFNQMAQFIFYNFRQENSILLVDILHKANILPECLDICITTLKSLTRIDLSNGCQMKFFRSAQSANSTFAADIWSSINNRTLIDQTIVSKMSETSACNAVKFYNACISKLAPKQIATNKPNV